MDEDLDILPFMTVESHAVFSSEHQCALQQIFLKQRELFLSEVNIRENNNIY